MENCENVLKNIEGVAKKWQNLPMSLLGKKLIINQCLLSKMWYYAYAGLPPKKIINKIKTAIYNFMWNYKKIRVSHKTIINL